MDGGLKYKAGAVRWHKGWTEEINGSDTLVCLRCTADRIGRRKNLLDDALKPGHHVTGVCEYTVLSMRETIDADGWSNVVRCPECGVLLIKELFHRR